MIDQVIASILNNIVVIVVVDKPIYDWKASLHFPSTLAGGSVHEYMVFDYPNIPYNLTWRDPHGRVRNTQQTFALNVTKATILGDHGLWTLTMCNEIGCAIGYVFLHVKGMVQD